MKTESWTLPKAGMRLSNVGECSQATLTHHTGGEPGLEQGLETQPQAKGEVDVDPGRAPTDRAAPKSVRQVSERNFLH